MKQQQIKQQKQDNSNPFAQSTFKRSDDDSYLMLEQFSDEIQN
jgi:hypothetical protein